jgi:7 transmembrane receptor (rhodopsin family)
VLIKNWVRTMSDRLSPFGDFGGLSDGTSCHRRQGWELLLVINRPSSDIWYVWRCIQNISWKAFKSFWTWYFQPQKLQSLSILMCRHSHGVVSFVGKLVPFIELTVAHSSILTILAISFERYYAICEPLKAGYVCTKSRAMIICVMCWITAGVFTR